MRSALGGLLRLKLGLLVLAVVSSPANRSEAQQTRQHRVRAGDSLWALARHYDVSVEALQSENGLGEATHIRTGQTLRIPVDVPTSGPDSPTLARASDDAPTRARLGGAAPPESQRTAVNTADANTANTNTANTNTANTNAANTNAAASDLAREPTSGSAPAREAELGRRLDPVTPAARDRAERSFFTDHSTAQVSTLDELAPRWVLEPPAAEHAERSATTSDGSHPCSLSEPGFGAHLRWKQIAPMAHVLLPKQVRLTRDGGFNVLFHFHGREPARKEWVRVMDGDVLVAIDVGIDSEAYRRAFHDPRTFGRVVQAVERAVARHAQRSAVHARRLIVSSWSAGFGAVEQILKQPFGRRSVLGVVLLDGLHAGYSGARSLDGERLGPFVQFARAAAAGRRLMYISHSSIAASGYASTTETANYLVWRSGGRPLPIDRRGVDPLGLQRIRTFSSGRLHVRGFAGGTAADHCAHLALLRDVLRVHVAPLWSEPAPALAPIAASRPAGGRVSSSR